MANVQFFFINVGMQLQERSLLRFNRWVLRCWHEPRCVRSLSRNYGHKTALKIPNEAVSCYPRFKDGTETLEAFRFVTSPGPGQIVTETHSLFSLFIV